MRSSRSVSELGQQFEEVSEREKRQSVEGRAEWSERGSMGEADGGVEQSVEGRVEWSERGSTGEADESSVEQCSNGVLEAELDSSFVSSVETESTCSMEECMVRVEEVLRRSLKVSPEASHNTNSQPGALPSHTTLLAATNITNLNVDKCIFYSSCITKVVHKVI